MPSRKHIRLARKQLDEALWCFRPVVDLNPPPKGWIRAIRDAIGMSGRQLAGRLGLSKQSVSRMERDELSGALSIKTLRRVAEGLDCVFVYGIVPRNSLDQVVFDRARAIAEDRLHRANQTMRLENQDLDQDENEEILTGMIDDLIEAPPTNFWDSNDPAE